RAVTYYRNKYGSAPEICVSHPTTIEDGANKRIAGVRIERIGAAGEAGSLAGLGLALFLAIAALLLYAMVGKILALFLAATRCEVPLLDCTASGADTLDVRAILDDLLSNESQVDETRSPQTRIFEWMDTPAGDDLTE
ncbi:MAG: hypothetical protein P8Z34_14225, partial [Anaerolineales bacterium]